MMTEDERSARIFYSSFHYHFDIIQEISFHFRNVKKLPLRVENEISRTTTCCLRDRSLCRATNDKRPEL
jgi:hypothetical protein